jgi:NADH:ubiquinone oxidoreductase subunit 2 (subunit N)
MTILKYVYLYRSEGDDKNPIVIPGAYKVAIWATAVGVLLLGVMMGPWVNIANSAAASIIGMR